MGTKLINKSEMIAQSAKIFDDLRSGDQVCFFIKRDVNTKDFSSVLELTTGWMVSHDKFRDSMLLRVATDEASFADLQAQSSFVAYGKPDSESEIDVYEISPDERDRIPPTETSPNWKFYITRIEKERFKVS